MESIIKESVLKHMMDKQLFSGSQFGFRSRRISVLQHLEAMEYWTESLDSGTYSHWCGPSWLQDIVWCSSTQTAIEKTICLWTRRQSISMDQCFLSRKKQCVILGDLFSTWLDFIIGVPKGSVLGPLVFLIYINDLPDALQCLQYNLRMEYKKYFGWIRIG